MDFWFVDSCQLRFILDGSETEWDYEWHYSTNNCVFQQGRHVMHCTANFLHHLTGLFVCRRHVPYAAHFHFLQISCRGSTSIWFISVFVSFSSLTDFLPRCSRMFEMRWTWTWSRSRGWWCWAATFLRDSSWQDGSRCGTASHGTPSAEHKTNLSFTWC